MSEKFRPFGEDWEERLEEQLTELEKDHPDTPLPNFSSAEKLFYRMHNIRYVDYMFDFCLRHPIMYMLFYRWWFIRSAPKEMQKYLPRLLRIRRRHGGWWHEFAAYHPILFLLWLSLYLAFQVGVKVLSAPVKAIRSLKV